MRERRLMTKAVPLPERRTSSADARLYRNVVGGFASGVVVVLCGDDKESLHGMTANSFTSVSIDPPLVLISVNNKAKMKAVIDQKNRFTLSILSNMQKDISNHFSGRESAVEPPVMWRQNRSPMIRDALGFLDCRLYQSVLAGDHTLYLGLVLAFERGEGEPLLFFKGSYAALENSMNESPQLGNNI